MNHTRSFAVFLATLLIVGTLGACGADPQPKALSISWSSHFDSAEALRDASDLIIRGVVTDSRVEKRGSLELTRHTVRIAELIRGEIGAEAQIDLVQTGSEAFGVPEELPLLEKGAEYLLFLEQTDPDPRYGQYYLVTGGYQGIARQDGESLVPLAKENADFVSSFPRVIGEAE